MKKLIAAAAALVLAGGVFFAGDFYNGDIQLNLGVGFGNVKVGENKDSLTKSTIADFGVESWHLFRPIDLLGVGFMVDLNGGIGGTRLDVDALDVSGVALNFNFAIGPAVGVYLGNIVRLGAAFGFNAGFNVDDLKMESWDENNGRPIHHLTTSYYSGYAGFIFGLQAKFFPNSKVNPVVGWKIVKGFSDTMNINDDSYDGDYDFTQNTLYIALSFNW